MAACILFFPVVCGPFLLIFDHTVAGMNGCIQCLMFLLGRGCNILKWTKRALELSDFKRYGWGICKKKRQLNGLCVAIS